MEFGVLKGEERYQEGTLLGKGAFGEVRQATDCILQRQVAVKKIQLKGRVGSSKTLPKPVFRELQSLRQLQSEAIVALFDTYLTESHLCLVLEFLPVDLSSIISKTKRTFSRSEFKYFAISLCKALAYCHSMNIIHRDIKPSNILLSIYGQVKLGDFGLARICPPDDSLAGKLSHQVATRWYRPPELLFASRSYNSSMDIWSAGAVLG